VGSIRDINCGASLWVLGGSLNTTPPKPTSYWAINPTLVTGNGCWTVGTGLPTTTTNNGCVTSISFGMYDSSYNAAYGIIPGTIFCLGGYNDTSSTCAYSTDGKIWTTTDSSFGNTRINSITWNGDKFVAVGGITNPCKISYSYNGINWFTNGLTSPSNLFKTSIYGVASNATQTIGSTYIDSAFTLNSSTGLNTHNELDVYSDKYFDNCCNNTSITIKSIQIP
jgi:hypothetical protein